MALQPTQDVCCLSFSGCEGSVPQPMSEARKTEEWEGFQSQFMKGSEKDARNVLMDYLSGREVRKIEGDTVSLDLLPSRMANVLKTYISERRRLAPRARADEEERQKWFAGWKRRIQRVRIMIPSGTLLGTTHKRFNALYGPARLELPVRCISQEANLRTNEHIDERLERWRSLGRSGAKPMALPEKRRVEAPELYSEEIEPMKIGGLPITICCAHAQGDRFTQEDGHAIGKITLPQDEIGYFSVIDGHSGRGLTKFLETYFGAVLREHLEIAHKSLKDLDKGELENLLTAFPVRLQQWWKQNCETWADTHLVDDQADEILQICYEEWCRNLSCLQRYIEKSGPGSLDKDVVAKIEERMSTILSSITGEVANQPRRIDSKDEKQQAAFLKHMQGLIVKEIIDISRLAMSDETVWLDSFLREISRRVIEQQDRDYDPGAVVALATILEEKAGPALWTVGVGDATILVFQDGQIFPMTEEASLGVKRFQEQIKRRGGRVIKTQHGLRVDCPQRPNFARAIGDFGSTGLTPRGDVQRIPLHPPATVVIGSDGLLDTLSYADIWIKCQELLSCPGVNAAKELVQCSYSKGSVDNISCVVVQILPNTSV